jgi:hypothetical protein
MAVAFISVCILAGQVLAPSITWPGYDWAAEPNPPTVDLGISRALSAAAVTRQTAAAVEWTFHKTSDNLHPDGNEQQMLWLANRARSDPAQEGVWLATEDDPDIAAARTFWGVNLTVLQNDFAAIPAKPPAAFDVRLYNAAKAHSDYIISIDSQTHDGQRQRVDASNFKWQSWAGIVFSYSDHALYGHAGFNIDWGRGPNGMQDPPGHRNAIMSVSGNYTNVGYAVVPESDPNTDVGPLVITGNFCFANTSLADHYNQFLVGTVWTDSNGNDRYDPGEGIGGVSVTPDQGAYYAVTANSGGYSIPITSAGTYQVAFSGSAVTTPVTRTVSIGSTSVLLDLKYSGGSPMPEANTGSATSITSTSAILHGTVIPNGFATTYYFQYGTTTDYGTQTTHRTTDIDMSVSETLTGLSPETAYHYRFVSANASGTSYGPDRNFRTAAASPGSNDGGGGSAGGNSGGDGSGSATSTSGGGGGGGGCLISAAAEHSDEVRNLRACLAASFLLAGIAVVSMVLKRTWARRIIAGFNRCKGADRS